MNATHGFIVAAIAFAITFSICGIVVGLVGAAMAWRQIQEERYGTGCRGAGGRRSRCRKGCTRAQSAESGCVDSTTKG